MNLGFEWTQRGSTTAKVMPPPYKRYVAGRVLLRSFCTVVYEKPKHTGNVPKLIRYYQTKLQHAPHLVFERRDASNMARFIRFGASKTVFLFSVRIGFLGTSLRELLTEHLCTN